MIRREFIVGLGGAVAWARAASAQPRTMPVIGFLHNQSLESMRDELPAFERGLAETGFVEGRNVAFDHRWAEGHNDRRPQLAADLVRRQVSIIVADATNAAADAKAATQTIPIVFTAGADPVSFGLVSSLSRPGANVTGVAMQGIEVTGKRVELLHKLVPAATVIGMFVGQYTRVGDATGARFTEIELRDFQAAAVALGLRAVPIEVASEADIAAAFATLLEQRVGALLIGSNNLFQQGRTQIILLAARHGIPVMFWDSTSVAAGALASYGPNFIGAWRQVGLYVGRILNGEKPANLPVIQRTDFDLMLNLKTAKALGLTIPPNLLALADQVIK
jgi:putative tryptophan/tyrosine transport system substrate-binding protein